MVNGALAGKSVEAVDGNGRPDGHSCRVRYVQLHYTGQPRDRLANELELLAQHYEFKTGGSLYLPYERVPTGVSALVQKAMQRLGERGLIELLAKAAGA